MTTDLDQAQDLPKYHVVSNAQGQYSILPDNTPLPAGWTFDGFCANREECLAHIEKVWTDMRPLTQRSV